MVGIVDLGVFTQEMLDVGDPEPTEEVFEALGFRLSELRGASLLKAFRIRFPWLLATIASGTAGVLLAGIFEATLARAIVVSVFLALVLCGGVRDRQALAGKCARGSHDRIVHHWLRRDLKLHRSFRPRDPPRAEARSQNRRRPAHARRRRRAHTAALLFARDVAAVRKLRVES